MAPANHGEEDLAEVTLIVEGEEIICSRNMLRQASDYFEGMFNSQMVESQARVIKLHNVPAKVFRALVGHAATRKLSLDTENVHDILTAASQFQFTEIINACNKFLYESISNDNCLTVMRLAEMSMLKTLHQKAKAHSLLYFEDVTESDDFLDLTAQVLKSYLREPMLDITTEMQIFSALLKWVEFDRDERMENFEDLFEVIDLSDLSREELKEIEANQLVKDHPTCLQLVEDVTEKLQSNSGAQKAKNDCSAALMPASCGRGLPLKLWMTGIGGKESGIHQFGAEKQEFTLVAVPPASLAMDRLIGHAICVRGTDFYVFGGEVDSMGHGTWQENVWKYDSVSQEWSVVCQMPHDGHRVRHHSVLVSGLHIYIIGGLNRFRIQLSTVYRLDTVTGEWTSLPRLADPVYGAILSLCRDSIYVVKFNNIQIHTPGQDFWTRLTFPATDDCCAPLAVCSWNDKIYFVGDTHGSLTELDPDSQTFTVLRKAAPTDAVTATAVYRERLCMVLDSYIDCCHSKPWGVKEHDMQGHIAVYNLIQRKQIAVWRHEGITSGKSRAVFMPCFPDFL